MLMPAAYRPAPLAVLARASATFLDAQASVDALVASMSYTPVNALFTAAKALVCCTIADALATMWVGLTYTGGWCGWVEACSLM